MDITEENEDKRKNTKSLEKMRTCFKMKKMKENDENWKKMKKNERKWRKMKENEGHNCFH